MAWCFHHQSYWIPAYLVFFVVPTPLFGHSDGWLVLGESCPLLLIWGLLDTGFIIFIHFIMTQPQIKQKIGKIIQSLSAQLNRAGFADKFQCTTTNDPWADLDGAHSALLGILNNLSLSKDTELTQNNEAVVLDCLRSFLNIHEEMSRFSKILYEGNYSLDLYKAYRKLYEEISKTSNQLYQFDSANQEFLKYKEELITENLHVCQEIQNAGPLTHQQRESNDEYSQSATQTVIEGLQKEIEVLNELIRQNDEEFTQEIQRYNTTLFDLQETVREYEIRMDKIRQFEATIDELEHKIIRLKEEKYRDDMLIDNMSKKIRLYEKERGGAEVFLSPRANYSRKSIISPGSRLINHSMLGSQADKSRNYYGERLVSQ